MRSSSGLLFLAVAVSASAACSAQGPAALGTGGGGGTGTAGSSASAGQMLQLLPADAVLDLPDGKPASLDYTAKIAGKDAAEDVTAEATFKLDDPTLGTFEGGKLTASGIVGKAVVHVSARGLDAETKLTIRTGKIILGPGAPPDAPGKFGGPVDGGRTPTFVYPADGVLVPPNMNELAFQFSPGAGNTLFELTFGAPSMDVKIYFTCTPVGAGCSYTPDAAAWKLLAEAGRGADPVTYSLRGVDGANPGSVGVSTAQAISFGEEDIDGGLYYWNALAGATMRYEFGVSGQKAELYLNAQTAGAGVCVGCHVLSRSGKRIVEGLDIPGPASYKVFDVATKATIYGKPGGFPGTEGANFFAFSPDDKQIMSSSGSTIVLSDAATGTPITNPLVAQGSMPDWSPDGKSMVYAKPPPCMGGFCDPTGVSSASLETMTFDGKAWSPGPSLVPFAGQNNYYPTFSPDGGWVLFNRASGNSYDAKDAQVWVVASAGGTPVHLANASTGGDSWPKWTPDVQKYKGNALVWLTFSSRRAYGLSGAGQVQLWMTAFDPALAKQGKDPSYPAFWLPFQDPTSGNHIAQWVTKVERQPCLQPTDCPSGEICENGLCLPVVK